MRRCLLAGFALAALCAAQPALNSYQEGIRLLRNQNWQAAAAALEKAVASEPKNVEAQIALGIARLRSGDVEAGLKSFRRAVQLNPASVDAHYNLGLALREAGQAPAALTEFATSVRLAPSNDEARLALAVAYQQSGKLDQAIAQCDAMIKRNPQSAEAHNWLGVFRMEKGQAIDAVASFRKAVEVKPDFVRAWNNLGSALAQSGDVEASVAAFKKSAALDPSDAELRMNLGIALRGKGDADAALHEFQSVLKTSPSNVTARHQLALTLKQQGDLAAAIEGFEAVLNLDSEHREAYYNLGSVLRQQAAVLRRAHPAARVDPAVEARLREAQAALARGDRAAARSILERASQEVKSADVFNLLGFVQGQERDLDAALASLKHAVELDPAMPAANYNLGVALWFGGARDAAVEALERSLRLDPAAPEVYSFLGMAHRERKEPARARTALQRAIALGPNLPAPYVDLGLLFLDAGQLEKGIGQIEAALNLPAPAGPIPDLDQVIAELRRALAASPNTAEIHNVLGLLLGKRGADPAQVIAEFRDAVRLRKDYAEARNNLGLVLVQAGDNEAGIAEFRQALAVAPDYTAALANLGAALIPSKPSEAVALLERAVALQPAYVRAQYNLALAYAQTPGAAKARGQFQKVIELQPDFAAAHFEYGKLLFQKGSLPEAIVQFREAVRLDPNLGAARYQLGLALTRAGQRTEGAAELEKARPAIEAERKLEIGGQLMGEARTAMESGQNEKAVDTLRKLVRELPSSVDAHYQLGLALTASGDRAGAAAAFQRALELDPQNASARQSLQRLQPSQSAPSTPADDPATVTLFEGYVRKQEFKELEPLVVEYLKTHPNSWWGYYVLGYAQFGQRRIGDSVASLAKSLQLNIRNAEAHQLLGRNLMAIGRFDAAQTELEQAVKLKPQAAEIRYDLAKIHSANDNYPPAKSELEEAIRLDPSYIDAYDALGFVMEAMSDDDSAVRLYKKAAEMNESRGSNFASPYVNLAAYYNRTGNSDLAQEYARKALQQNAKSDGGNFQLGKALERQGKLPEAADALNRAIAINPGTSSYHYVLSGVYRRLGKTKEAQEQMDTFRKLEKEAADFEQKRREGRQASRPKQ